MEKTVKCFMGVFIGFISISIIHAKTIDIVGTTEWQIT